MNVQIENSQSVLSLSENGVKRLVNTFLKSKDIECDEVVIHFVGKEEISLLHAKYFNDPSPTDCISFPIDSPKDPHEKCSVLGEVFVCPEVAIEYAKQENSDPYIEVSLYIVHGLLHLLGFDDIEMEEKKVMRGEENSAMDYLKENKALLYA